MRTQGQKHTLPLRASGGNNGFTLLEVLVAMSIATILIGLLIGGTHGFNSSTRRRSAVGTLMGVFDQARTVATSDGRATYVVFISAAHGSNQNASAVAPGMWGQAYALFEDPVLQDNTTTASFQPQQRSTWLYLPTGIAFKCDNSIDNVPASLTASVPVSSDTTKFSVPASGGGTVVLSLPYLKFDATGQIVDYQNQLLDPGSPLLRVLLFQGTASGAGTETVTQRSAGTTGANVKFALDEIMLKSITGRAHYTQDPVYNLAAAN